MVQGKFVEILRTIKTLMARLPNPDFIIRRDDDPQKGWWKSIIPFWGMISLQTGSSHKKGWWSHKKGWRRLSAGMFGGHFYEFLGDVCGTFLWLWGDVWGSCLWLFADALGFFFEMFQWYLGIIVMTFWWCFGIIFWNFLGMCWGPILWLFGDVWNTFVWLFGDVWEMIGGCLGGCLGNVGDHCFIISFNKKLSSLFEGWFGS